MEDVGERAREALLELAPDAFQERLDDGSTYAAQIPYSYLQSALLFAALSNIWTEALVINQFLNSINVHLYRTPRGTTHIVLLSLPVGVELLPQTR